MLIYKKKCSSSNNKSNNGLENMMLETHSKSGSIHGEKLLLFQWKTRGERQERNKSWLEVVEREGEEGWDCGRQGKVRTAVGMSLRL